MFLHQTMSDAEILRTCDGCASPHLRLVADRLRERADILRQIHEIASGSYLELIEGMDRIRDLSDIGKPLEG